MPLTCTPSVAIHGRYLVEPAGAAAPAPPLLVGFHGYAEDAELQLDRLRSVPGIETWLTVSIQGLHRFYRRRGRDRVVVASWMTRQDRELLMADNLAYVAKVVDEVTRAHGAGGPVVFAGFSQGVAMAFRAASGLPMPVAGVIAIGGDVPPEIDAASLARIPMAVVGRGTRDDLYPSKQWTADQARLRAAGVDVDAIAFDGGHEWTPAFNGAAGSLLRRIRSSGR